MIVDPLELECRNHFDTLLVGEMKIVNDLIEVFQDFLNKTNGSIKDTDHPQWSVMLGSGSNLQLALSAINSLRNGYFRTSLITSRTMAEQVVTAMYFLEFPQKEEEFRSMGYKEFNKKNGPWLEGPLKKIDAEGKIFVKDNNSSYWHDLVWNGITEELNHFSHFDADSVYGTLASFERKEQLKHFFVPGPQKLPKNLYRAVVCRILELVLCSMVVIWEAFKIQQTSNETNVIKTAVSLCNEIKKDPSVEI